MIKSIVYVLIIRFELQKGGIKMKLKLKGTYEPEEILKVETTDKTFTFTDKDSSENISAIIIPECCTELGNGPYEIFQIFPNLKEVIWPKISILGKYMFAYCTELRYFQTNSCPMFSEAAFRNTHLMEITLPKNTTALGSECFKECLHLKSVNMGKTKTPIIVNDYCFNRCDNLTDFDFNKCCIIGKYAFYKCKTENVIINKNCHIGAHAFSGSKIEYLEINSEVNLAGNSFSDCPSLRKVKLNKSIKTLPTQTFFNDTLLSEITGVEGVENVGKDCFDGCSLTSLESFTGLKKIGDLAFAGNKFVELTINADEILCGAFMGCTSLKKVTMTSPEITKFPTGIFKGVNLDCLDLSKTSISIIPEFAFVDMEINEVYLPNNLKTIESSAFERTEITKITIPDSVTSIKESAFFACKNLYEVVWGQNCKVLCKNLFAHCINLNSFTGSEYIESIEDFAISGVKADLNLSGLKDVSDAAFDGYQGLADLRMSSIILKNTDISNVLFPYFYE